MEPETRSGSAAVTPGADGTVHLGRSGPVTAQKLTRSGRVRKWDREPTARDWRYYVGNLGKTLIAVGLLMFGFVGYQLYGTGLETAAAQNRLEDEFADQLAQFDSASAPTFEETDGSGAVVDAPQASDGEIVDDTDDGLTVPGENEPASPDPVSSTDLPPASPAVPVTPTDLPPAPPAVPVAAQNIPAGLTNGDAIAKIEIPRIGLDDIIVAGVETGDLKKGPGHFPNTPLPGQLGNSAIAGHRTTYGQPFRNVDQLENGDEIQVTTLNGVFVYEVTGQSIVEPSDYQVVATTDPTTANLTLTSCHPVFTARQRIVIFSELNRVESAPVGEPVIDYGRAEAVEAPAEIPGDDDLPAEDDVEIAVEPIEEPTAEPSGEPTEEPTAEPIEEPTAGSSGEPTADASTNSGDATGSLTDVSPTASEPGSEATNEDIADAFSDGWFSDPSANPQVGLWGLAVGAIAIAAYAISRRFRRDLLGLTIGILPFVVALYFFFQNVNRLLPPNL